jgi:hypothetical protein
MRRMPAWLAGRVKIARDKNRVTPLRVLVLPTVKWDIPPSIKLVSHSNEFHTAIRIITRMDHHCQCCFKGCDTDRRCNLSKYLSRFYSHLLTKYNLSGRGEKIKRGLLSLNQQLHLRRSLKRYSLQGRLPIPYS